MIVLDAATDYPGPMGTITQYLHFPSLNHTNITMAQECQRSWSKLLLDKVWEAPELDERSTSNCRTEDEGSGRKLQKRTYQPKGSTSFG
eukprot:3477186-Rhodomonas_salina.1